MLAHRQIQVLRIDLEEAIGMQLGTRARTLLGEISPDSISVEHRAELFLERTHHRDSWLTDDLAIFAAPERQQVKAGKLRRRHFCAFQRLDDEAGLRAAQ